MKVFTLLGLMLALVIGASAETVDQSVISQLAPTGSLRVGVAYAPALTPTFVVKDASDRVCGGFRGVPCDLGEALAKKLGVPVRFFAAATTAEVADAIDSGAVDIGLMPVNDARRQRFGFSPPYFFIESTYLAIGASDIATLADVDREGITVVGVAGSTTMQAASRSLKRARVVAAKSVDEAMALLQAGTAQAFALTHDALPPLQRELPGSRILDGAFQIAEVAIGVRKDRPAALAYITSFIEQAKADGAIRRAFDDAGLGQLPVAP